MGDEYEDYGACGKKLRSERPMTTALFMLRCVQIGLSIADLDLLTIGSVNDMFLESQRDEYSWDLIAGQEQFDQF